MYQMFRSQFLAFSIYQSKSLFFSLKIKITLIWIVQGYGSCLQKCCNVML